MSVHTYYDRDDGLLHCKVCGGAEGSLPTCCPGTKMSADVNDAVYAGKLNFNKGPMDPVPKWWEAHPSEAAQPNYGHLAYCNFWTKPIGSPGCVCKVVGKNDGLTAEDGSTAEENIRFLLDKCRYTIRVREGGGPESLIDSLITTFTAMQHRLEGLDK